MGKPFLISLIFHVLLITLLLAISITSPPLVTLSESVSIRISAAGSRIEHAGSPAGGSPSQSKRDIPASVPLARTATKAGVENLWRVSNPEIVEIEPSISRLPVQSVPSLRPGQIVSPDIAEGLDPLEGLEHALPQSGDETGTNKDPWSISWVNGGYRGILSYPELDPNAIPEETDRLLNLSVQITVSPQGEVIFAEIEEPGSGDIRIDRYMNNLALSFVFAPLPSDENNLTGTLRLLFLGGNNQ